MTDLDVAVLAAGAEPHAAVPTLTFRLGVTERSGTDVHAVLLRAQIRIEPQKRRYDTGEVERLGSLFGPPANRGQTLRPFLWTQVVAAVPGFSGSCDIDLPVACSYDLEVAAHGYFQSLGDGHIPLLFLFSGTVFSRGPAGVQVEPVGWSTEATFPLPVRTWREMMDRYWPGQGWVRLSRPTIDDLNRYRTSQALAGWDQTVAALLAAAEVNAR